MKSTRHKWESEPTKHRLNMDYVLTGSETRQEFLRKIDKICKEWVAAMSITRRAVTREDIKRVFLEAYDNGLIKYEERQQELMQGSPDHANGSPKVFQKRTAAKSWLLVIEAHRDFFDFRSK